MNPRDAQQTSLPRFLNLLLAFTLAAVVVVISGALTYRAALNFYASGQELQRGYAVLDSLQTLEIRYLQADSALRGYMVTRDAGFRGDYELGVARVDSILATARERMSTDSAQDQSLQDIAQLIAERRTGMSQALLAFERGGLAEILNVGSNSSVREPERQLLKLLTEAKSRRERLIAERLAEVSQRLSRLKQQLAIFFAISLALLLLFFLRARRAASQQETLAQEVERQRRLSDSIVENAPMGVFLKETENFTLVRVNRFIEDIAGRTRQEMLGKDDSQFVGAALAHPLIEAERELVRRRQMLSFEEVQIETTRGKRDLHVRKVLIPDEDGQIRYMLGLSEDVTERRRAETAQREFSETLERKSRELEVANKELESFSYSVSHDLRAPLRAVEGYAAILEEDYGPKLDDEGRRFLHNIREGATRMGQLIQDLLSFSRLSRQPLSFVETDTRVLVQGAWHAIRAAHPGLRAEFTVGELPVTFGDARLLQQVWTNLLENAVKYSSKAQEPRVTVGGAADGLEVVFEIQDNGVGFDMRYYDKLFNVFQRLHSEAEYSGTGVGLAIVQRIIARHGGRVWARSEPGRGATFSFALPCKPGG